MNEASHQDTSAPQAGTRLHAFAYLCFGLAAFAAVPMFYYAGERLVLAVAGAVPRFDKWSFAAALVMIAVSIKLAARAPLWFGVIFLTAIGIFLAVARAEIFHRFFGLGFPLIAAAVVLFALGAVLARKARQA